MKYLLSLGVLALVPFVSSAATFHYVTSNGYTATVEADSAAEALVTAPNIAANSGVAIDRGLIEPGTPVPSVTDNGNAAGYQNPNTETYVYVNAQGYTADVAAPSAEVALEIAPNIAANSGVAVDDGTIEPGTPVPSVVEN